jgi:hypothetical protein
MLFFLSSFFDLLCFLVKGLFFLLDLFSIVVGGCKLFLRAYDALFSWLESLFAKREEK